jgi:hypothetical protein
MTPKRNAKEEMRLQQFRLAPELPNELGLNCLLLTKLRLDCWKVKQAAYLFRR